MKTSLFFLPLVLSMVACVEEGGVPDGGARGDEVVEAGEGAGPVGAEAEEAASGGAGGAAAGDGGGGGEGESGAGERPDDGAFVGLGLEEGMALAERHGIPARVVKVDGEDLIVTQDYVEERLNFTVEKGVITEVKRG